MLRIPKGYASASEMSKKYKLSKPRITKLYKKMGLKPVRALGKTSGGSLYYPPISDKKMRQAAEVDLFRAPKGYKSIKSLSSNRDGRVIERILKHFKIKSIVCCSSAKTGRSTYYKITNNQFKMLFNKYRGVEDLQAKGFISSWELSKKLPHSPTIIRMVLEKFSVETIANR